MSRFYFHVLLPPVNALLIYWYWRALLHLEKKDRSISWRVETSIHTAIKLCSHISISTWFTNFSFKDILILFLSSEIQFTFIPLLSSLWPGKTDIVQCFWKTHWVFETNIYLSWLQSTSQNEEKRRTKRMRYITQVTGALLYNLLMGWLRNH